MFAKLNVELLYLCKLLYLCRKAIMILPKVTWRLKILTNWIENITIALTIHIVLAFTFFRAL